MPILTENKGKNSLKIEWVWGIEETKNKTRMGWGRCSVTDCPCRGYESSYGTSELCNNFGHSYSSHD
jgi:hypothetical protein